MNFGIKMTRIDAKGYIKCTTKQSEDVLTTNYVHVSLSLTELSTGELFRRHRRSFLEDLCREGWTTVATCYREGTVTIIVVIHTYHKWTPAHPKPIPAKQLASCICDRASVSSLSFTAL